MPFSRKSLNICQNLFIYDPGTPSTEYNVSNNTPRTDASQTTDNSVHGQETLRCRECSGQTGNCISTYKIMSDLH